MRIALVHDYLVQYGGAERVLEEFASLFPDAPIYTLVYDAASTGHAFSGRDIRTSFLQKIPKIKHFYRLTPMLMPLAIESLDLSDYDLVISSSSSFAKGVLTKGSGVHVCYCHSPMRYAWFDYKKIAGDSMYPSAVARVIPFVMPYMRMWDMQSAQRPDYYICNSNFIKDKIKKYYKRDAATIHPPVNFKNFTLMQPQDYFLIVGRMVPYKRFDLAIEAFNKLKLPLKIIGTGPEYKKLKAMAGPTIEFLGSVPEKKLQQHYARAKAFIFPQEEDFGITALESMASGRPVIAYGKGGATESVIDGKTGVLFYKQTSQAIVEAVKKFQTIKFDPVEIRESVEQFDKVHFKKRVVNFLEAALKNSNKLIRS